MRENGSLVAFETGQVTAYALETAQERGQMFCKPGDQVMLQQHYWVCAVATAGWWSVVHGAVAHARAVCVICSAVLSADG